MSDRAMRSSITGQEEMCSALWDFARDVLALNGNHSFVDNRHDCTDSQLGAIRKAMERISAGYGYRVLEIQ